MSGPRRAADGAAEGLAQVHRKRLRGGHVGAVLRHRGEWLVVDLLVGVALQVVLPLATGQRDDR